MSPADIEADAGRRWPQGRYLGITFADGGTVMAHPCGAEALGEAMRRWLGQQQWLGQEEDTLLELRMLDGDTMFVRVSTVTRFYVSTPEGRARSRGIQRAADKFWSPPTEEAGAHA